MTAATVPDLLLKIVAQRRERLRGEVESLEPTAERSHGGERPIATGQQSQRLGASSSAAGARLEPVSAAPNAFLAALATRQGQAVIAEIKMGSPRLGSLVGKVDPQAQARLYAEHGAAALSVVVEPDFFCGSYELLARCREASGLPAIAKDFIVDSRQLHWAREAGADAILLIAALYSAEELASWADEARALGLVPLIETHSEADLERLTGRPWELVGVNNRNLRTFEVELERSVALAPRLPIEAIKVAESGIASGADRVRLAAAGFDAFLVGEALLLAADPAAKLAELVGR